MARKAAKEITSEEDKELADLLRNNPYAMYTQEIDGEWKNTHNALQENEVDTFLKNIKSGCRKQSRKGCK